MKHLKNYLSILSILIISSLLTFTSCTGDGEDDGLINNGAGSLVHEYVDLGLSVKWATCNVGATKPEEYGYYFAWGETATKKSYTSDNYTYTSNSSTLPLTADAAHVNWGGNWRMPTRAEQDELRNTSNCTWTWTTQNGVNGYRVVSKLNGNSIFLPAAGMIESSRKEEVGYLGVYWSSSRNTDYTNAVYYIILEPDKFDWDYNPPYTGRSVRAVCE